MKNLGKPLRDSERYLHVWQQAGGLTDGTRLEAVMISGLPQVTLAHAKHPTAHTHTHFQGIPADLWLLWRSFLATAALRTDNRKKLY